MESAIKVCMHILGHSVYATKKLLTVQQISHQWILRYFILTVKGNGISVFSVAN